MRVENRKPEFGPLPEITPEMIQTTFKALETKGMVYYGEGGVYVPTEKGWKLLKETKEIREEIIAHGHPNITATHTTTLEITKDAEIKKDADCIIAVGANKACKDLNKELHHALKEGKKLEITLEAEGVVDRIKAFGSPALELNHPRDIVIRKSDFIDSRTLVILADKSANEIRQDLVEKLRNSKTEVKIILEIK